MMQAALITVGNELLSGYTLDTNAASIGRALVELGVALRSCQTVPDEVAAIAEAVERASQQADLLLITGGLGPTDDDVTRHALARVLGGPLVLHEDQLGRIRSFFEARGYPMPERNRIQAELPTGSEAIDNARGTAPGIRVTRPTGAWFALPGVPTEMEAMFHGAVAPWVRSRVPGQAIATERLHCFGVGESTLAERLGDRMRRDRNPLINCTVDQGVLTLHVVAREVDADRAATLARSEAERLAVELGNLVFGRGEETLAAAVVRCLRDAGRTVATAESCTGGLVAKLLTDVSGASAVFRQGWVTYCNEAKVEQLGVRSQDLERHGAVSEAVARAMACGARDRSGADYALAITGIAGPGGGTAEKPVGLVEIAVAGPDGCQAREYRFPWDRPSVRERAAQTALNALRRTAGF